MSNASSDRPQRPVSAANRRWVAVAVLFVVFVFVASQVVSGLLVSIYPLLKHWSHSQAADWLSNSVGAQFVFILVAEAITIGAVLLFLRWRHQAVASIGLRRPRWSDVAYALTAVPLYFVLYLFTVALVSHFVPSLNVNQQQQIGFNNVQGSLQLVLTFISLVILPPLAEEIMVRGFLYSNLKKALPTISAALVTSVLFASAHLSEGGAAGPLYIAALDTFVLSLVLVYLREKTDGLWASMVLHAIKNGVAFMALFVFHVR